MNRPYIFCHMMTSLDGKIMGSYMNTKEGENAGNVFYNISFGENPYYKHQGWLSGRVTTDDNFTFYEKPALDENAPVVPEGDFVANGNAGMYYVSVDPAGKLGWKSGKLTYVDTHAHVIEVLTGKASNSYKAFLRKLGISYIVAGVETLDYEMAMEKLKKLFIDRLVANIGDEPIRDKYGFLVFVHVLVSGLIELYTLYLKSEIDLSLAQINEEINKMFLAGIPLYQ